MEIEDFDGLDVKVVYEVIVNLDKEMENEVI